MMTMRVTIRSLLRACRPAQPYALTESTVSSVPKGDRRVATLSDVPLYAAYGSNMDPNQMMERAPYSPLAGTGWLVGWRMTFGGEDLGWEGALATIVEDGDSQVFVVLYDVTPEDETRLDRWDGSELGLHSKIRLRVQTLEGSRPE